MKRRCQARRNYLFVDRTVAVGVVGTVAVDKGAVDKVAADREAADREAAGKAGTGSAGAGDRDTAGPGHTQAQAGYTRNTGRVRRSLVAAAVAAVAAVVAADKEVAGVVAAGVESCHPAGRNSEEGRLFLGSRRGRWPDAPAGIGPSRPLKCFHRG